MKNISDMTKRFIFNLFKNGFTVYNLIYGYENIFYPYYGRLEEIDFLKKLYDLDSMPGKYEVFENAEQEIIENTITNHDYEFGWVFNDERFHLKYGDDEVLLNFLCAIFHPDNREENSDWFSFLLRVNEYLKSDGYELYEEIDTLIISFNIYKNISTDEKISEDFIPFSARNNNIHNNSIKMSQKVKEQIFNILIEFYNNRLGITDYRKMRSIENYEMIFTQLKKYYDPFSYESKEEFKYYGTFYQYVVCNNLEKIFDLIEIFSHYEKDAFQDSINYLFMKNKIPYVLSDGIINLKNVIFIENNLEKLKLELKKLIDQAINLFFSKNIIDLRIAINILFDIIEGIALFYLESQTKKRPMDFLINEFIFRKEGYKIILINEYFAKLENLVNLNVKNYEFNKCGFYDIYCYKYVYQKCFSVIYLILNKIGLSDLINDNNNDNRILDYLILDQ